MLFPSTTIEMIRKALGDLFEPISVINIFNYKNVRWFLRNYKIQRTDPKNYPYEEGWNPADVLYALREIIIWLTTFEDRLPQGAPTSSHLFNLVVANQHLPTIAKLFPGNNPLTVTVYVDNITVSVESNILPSNTVEKTIAEIEHQTLFRVNTQKTRVAFIKNGSPNITGLSIGTKFDSQGNAKKIISVPQKQQRKARGLLHQAIFKPKLRKSALSMVGYLIKVYGSMKKLPRQIRDPYKKLLAAM